MQDSCLVQRSYHPIASPSARLPPNSWRCCATLRIGSRVAHPFNPAIESWFRKPPPCLQEDDVERKTAHDFDQDLLILFDAYVHGALDRRGFLDKAAKYAVGGVTAAMLLD